MSHSLKTRLFSGLIIIVTVLLLYQIKILWLFPIIISIAMICELLIISKKFFEKKIILLICIMYILLFTILFMTSTMYKECNFTVLAILCTVWSVDTFAYIGGKLFGGTKLAPSISPNKTWSGAICGIVAGMICYAIFESSCLTTDIHEVMSNFSSRVIVFPIAAIIGDLIESKLKRCIGIKDMSNIIPGHGGFCDRFDSFIFVMFINILYNLFLKY